MDRLVATLLLVLIVAVTGLGFVVWRADQHARDDAERLRCLEQAQATATIALLTPADRIDADGRLATIQTLGEQIDAC